MIYKNFSLVTLLILILCCTSSCSSTLSSTKLGTQMPEARLYFVDGQLGSLADYKGKDLILIFWASNCSASFSALQDLSNWKTKNPDSRKFQVVTVNIDKAENEAKVKELIKRLGYSKLIHSFSGNDIYDEAYVALDVSDLPTIMRIDRSGKVVAVASALSGVLD